MIIFFFKQRLYVTYIRRVWGWGINRLQAEPPIRNKRTPQRLRSLSKIAAPRSDGDDRN